MTRFPNGFLILKEEKMHVRICDQNVMIRKIALARWTEVEKNVNPSWKLETDCVGQRLALEPCPLN